MKVLALRSCRAISSGSSCLRWIFLFFGIFVFVEVLIFNIVIVYIYGKMHSELASFTEGSSSVFDKLMANKKINSFLFDAKADGVFTRLLQETIERMYINHNSQSARRPLIQDESGKRLNDISFIGIDVSHSKESTYIYQRILQRKSFPYHFLIVDIGANDGFLSSNSFNFIQWGWDAVLVDPQSTEIVTAKMNLKNYIDKYNDGIQKVAFEQAAIADHDGSIEFVITEATQGTESHVKSRGQRKREGDTVVVVPCISVKTLVDRYKIPKYFGILSLDVEGMGAEILRFWIDSEFRPAYIIFEHLHLQEPLSDTVSYLKENGYRYIGTRGWNVIFEHVMETQEKEGS
ncbi:uncharacterized protein LOC101862211 [Aplysia californica]|uniref:Uncharacterized protein LOC101862211 n=1 Tax=Aplysia californica TaxID=6500 RepID=A0ABM0K1H6_APLCA|nr:uncharacterized protein LOC101862211 [Aplysia californica]